MITRIVKLTFDSSRIEDFQRLFINTKSAIESSQGCIELKLMRDVSNPNVFFTISKWESESALNKYRKSELFEKVWAETKSYFSGKPEAWTLAEK